MPNVHTSDFSHFPRESTLVHLSFHAQDPALHKSTSDSPDTQIEDTILTRISTNSRAHKEIHKDPGDQIQDSVQATSVYSDSEGC